MIDDIIKILGSQADDLLKHTCKTISKDDLHLPGPDFVDRVISITDRNARVMRNLQSVFDRGRLAGTGYLSILPVDQGIEHSGGASFAKNPDYFDPAKIVELAIEGGCNAVASTFGVLHRLPGRLLVFRGDVVEDDLDRPPDQVGQAGDEAGVLQRGQQRLGRPQQRPGDHLTVADLHPAGLFRQSPPADHHPDLQGNRTRAGLGEQRPLQMKRCLAGTLQIEIGEAAPVGAGGPQATQNRTTSARSRPKRGIWIARMGPLSRHGVTTQFYHSRG